MSEWRGDTPETVITTRSHVVPKSGVVKMCSGALLHIDLNFCW